MRGNNLKDKFIALKYRKLYMLEIEFNNNHSNMSKEVMNEIISKISDEIKMISIVIDNKNVDIKLLNVLVTKLKRMDKSISLTVKGTIRDEKLFCIKNKINQFRFIINKIESEYINDIYIKFKTDENDIIFINEVSDVGVFKDKLEPLIKRTQYIFNINIKNGLTKKDYWILSKELSVLKSKLPLSILYDMPCAVIKYKNLQGICPGFICLLCIDVDGYGKLCYKQKANYKYNIKDYELNKIFDILYEDYMPLNYCEKFDVCFGGCPIHRTKNCNKYCGMKGGVT